MFTVEDSTDIDAPPERAFAFVDDPSNLVAAAPALAELDVVGVDREGRPAGRYTYRLAGIDLGGRFHVTRREPHTLLVREFSGGVDGTLRTAFEAAARGTVATYRAVFDLPAVVRERLPDAAVRTYCRRDVAATLANLKARLEHGR